MMIAQAVYDFTEAINDILLNTDSKHIDPNENLRNLVTLLESEKRMDFTEDSKESTGGCHSSLERGLGCLEILLANLLHPQLVPISLKHSLASSLFQSLRLLRIMEVLHANNSSPSETSSTSSQPLTSLSAKRLCCLLQHLCLDPLVLDEMRPNLGKLFCFPLSTKPGRHLQAEALPIIQSIASHALSWQLVWFLHDSRVIISMLGLLRSIVFTSEDTVNMEAEEAELWLLGARAVVELVSASAKFTGVLIVDYLSSHGDELLASIILHSRKERMPGLLQLAMRVYFSAAKGALDIDIAPFPPVLTLLLLSTLSLTSTSLGIPS